MGSHLEIREIILNTKSLAFIVAEIETFTETDNFTTFSEFHNNVLCIGETNLTQA